MYGQDIKAPLAKLLVLFIENEPVFEIAVVAERIKIYCFLLDERKYALRSGLVEVKLDLSVLVQ